MNKKLILTKKINNKKFASVFFFNVLLSLWSSHSLAGMKHEPMIAAAFVDQFEIRDVDNDVGQSNAVIFDMQAWVGKDINKLWFKMDLERVDSEIEHAELQALYSKAFASYWDLQFGLRNDFKPEPSRSWAVVGIKGLAPYYFEIDSALFFGEEGRAAFRFEAEYDLLFTQKLILTPQLTLNAYAKDDFKLGLAKGLADSEIGLRLRYEIKREFAPYVGVSALNKYGDTADYVESLGEKSHEVELVLGLKFWF